MKTTPKSDIETTQLAALQKRVAELEAILFEKNSQLKPADSLNFQIESLSKSFEYQLIQNKSIINQDILEQFFNFSIDGFFVMMLKTPVEWNENTDKQATLDYVFNNQHITRANDALLQQYGANRTELIGITPAELFSHNIQYGKELWLKMFDVGVLKIETDERKLDGTQIFVEGDYICLYNNDNQITGHIGIQRDITKQKNHENQLKKNKSLFELLYDLSRKQFATEKELIEYSLEHAVNLCESRFGFVHLLSNDQQTIELETVHPIKLNVIY